MNVKKLVMMIGAASGVAMGAFGYGQMPIEQELPVSFGITSKGTHRLDGRFLDARIYSRAISDAEAAAYSKAADGAASITKDGLVWEGVPTPGDRCNVVKKADYSNGFTFACRVILDKVGGRLIDNTTGGCDGWLIDTWPDRPRFYCCGMRVGDHKKQFAIGRAQSLVATLKDGKTSIWLDGERCDYSFDPSLLRRSSWSDLVEKKAKPLEWIFPTGDETPQEGMRFADGVTGVLAWGGGDTLKFTVGRADLWDHRGGYRWTDAQSYTNITDAILKKDKERLLGLFKKVTPPGEPRNPFMLPLGRVEVKIPGATLLTGAFDVKTGIGTIDFILGGRTNCAELAMSKKSRVFALKLPEGISCEAKSVCCMEQPNVKKSLEPIGFTSANYTADGFTWKPPADEPVTLKYALNGGELVIATWRGGCDQAKEQQAYNNKSFAQVRVESAAHWAKFWAEGARVKVPDPVVQGLFDYGMYCFGCMTDPDGVPCGLQGAWFEDNYIAPWSGDYHFNINVQECYSPAYRGGHFANMMPLFRMILSWKPLLRENARKFADVEGYVLPHSVDDRGVNIGGFWTGTIDHGSTAWVADMMFRYVKYSRDVDFLRRDAYDFMKGAMRVYRAMMTDDGKGGLAFPTGPSPEWGGSTFETAVGRNPSFQLAAAHRLARNLIAAAAMLGEAPDPMWLDVEKRLPLAAIDDEKGGIMLFENRPFSASHRHHSHLAGLFPFDIFDLDDPATAATVKKTYETWDARGTSAWTGWCVPWAAVLNVHAGRAEQAVKLLHDFDEYFTNPGHAPRCSAWKPGFRSVGRPKIGKDGRHIGHEILDMDGLLSACAAVMEMMAHEVNGKTEFFRGCPAEWKDVSFENIALSDGRRVSGRRLDGKVKDLVFTPATLCAKEVSGSPAPVVFDTPAADEKGVMVLGNGEVGATAWLDAAGTLHTVLQNSDSWNEGGRHVKTGAIDYETKAPVDVGTYRQELSMARGEFEASWKSGGKPVTVRYRIQHGTDSIAVCEVKGAPKAEAKVVNWRLYPGGSKEFGVGEYELGIRFCEGYFVDNVKDLKFTISADRLVPGGWCHVNRNETVKELMKVYDYYQATGDLGKPDLLSDRVFGGVTRKITGTTGILPVADGGTGTTGVSPVADGGTGTTGILPVASVNGQDARSPSVLFLTAVTCLHPCKDEAEWLRRTNEMLDRDGWTLEGEEAKRAEHIAAWAKFWDRSHIVVSPAAGTAGKTHKGFAFQTNGKLPVSFGVDSKGGNKFLGKFSFAEVEFDGKVVYSGVPKAGDVIAATGKMPVVPVNGQDARSPSLFRFTCRFTTDNAARPQRIIDNITPGKSDGFLVDLLSGRVRMIVGKHTFTHRAKVPSRREVAVEAVVPKTGQVKIVVDGKCETFEAGVATVADACAAVTRAYAAQRYTAACAGQGRLPIRFNGSLFTTEEKGDPDYRRWGNGYWWQNTRLPYYPMFVAGDLDMLKPLFRMYLGFLDFNMKRTRKYLGHGGAYFPECVQPWGDHFIGSYGPECAWKDRKDKLQHHPCHKYEWVGQLEISLMLLDYQAYMQDTAWFRKNALPSIREYVRYFDEHYKLDERGRYHMYPAQAVETWQDCTNPMPEIAGLTRVTDLLLALPDDTLESGDRELFTKIRSRIPDLPTRRLGSTGTTGVSPVDDGKIVFAPGARFDRHRNVETPELYCVFPFRLCSFEKSNAAIGLRTYPVRFHKHYRGWAQDELNAAYLGLADEAAEHLANRVLHNSAGGFRWPAYWGPNFDWRPDQCAGGNIQNILQSMLMQYEGKKIFLLPAWPKDWNCDFKLHAPYNTTVEGRVENGELKDLVVTPASRRADVTVCR